MMIDAKRVLCDVVMPSVTDILEYYVRRYWVGLILVLVGLLVIAAAVLMIVIARKKDRDAKNSPKSFDDYNRP